MGTFNWDNKPYGGTRKIADAPEPACLHPEHDPASMIVREPGTYEHACPGCGNKQVFTVECNFMR